MQFITFSQNGSGSELQRVRRDRAFNAVQNGELETVESMADEDPNLLTLKTVHGRLTALHVAAANGRIEVLSMLLDRFGNPDILNRHKQTPLMLAAMHGKISCVERLIQAGANILLFDTLYGRTCLHYAAYHGHSDCLQLILSAANSTHVTQSCYPGSTPLHLAAREARWTVSVNCLLGVLTVFKEILLGEKRIPYMVAMKHKHDSCAALLNPLAPEPLTWPPPLKFISDINPDVKALLQKALIEANKKREKAILMDTPYSLQPPPNSGGLDDESEAGDADLCCICFEEVCSIEVQNCGHQMCANCVLALCCHSKSNSSTNSAKIPVCPFCRSSIIRLVVAKSKDESDIESEFSPTIPRRRAEKIV
ncbi:hypothetical protein DH2020_026040 [Rehmannia glutinosa]|uniref:RING-type E3 ubiquitin transferase n=1 Tax=Rehmannia glutinosa TaxID=99300 RepID=A0ABR0VZ15_REHGL